MTGIWNRSSTMGFRRLYIMGDMRLKKMPFMLFSLSLFPRQPEFPQIPPCALWAFFSLSVSAIISYSKNPWIKAISDKLAPLPSTTRIAGSPRIFPISKELPRRDTPPRPSKYPMTPSATTKWSFILRDSFCLICVPVSKKLSRFSFSTPSTLRWNRPSI